MMTEGDAHSVPGPVIGAASSYRRVTMFVTVAILVGFLSFAGRMVYRHLMSVAVPNVSIPGVHPSVSDLLAYAKLRVERQPDSGPAWGHYGMCLMQHDRPHEALICFQEATKHDPEQAQWHYFSGVILEQTSFQDAAQSYASALHLDPDYVPLLLRNSAVQMNLGHFRESGRLLEDVAQRFPEIAETYVQLVRLERSQGTPCEAARWLLAAQGQQAVSASLLQESASAELQCGNAEKARRLLEEAKSAVAKVPLQDPWLDQLRVIDVSGAVASANADAFRQQGQSAKAEETLAILARRFPERSRPALNHALALRDQGRIEEAVQELRGLAQRFPDDPLVHFQYVVMLVNAGQSGTAINELQECLRLKPDYGLARAAMGDLLEAQGRTEEAIDCYRQAVRDSVGDPWIRFGFAALLMRQGRSAEADSVLAAAAPLVTSEQAPETAELERLKQELIRLRDQSVTPLQPPAPEAPLQDIESHNR